MTRAPSGVAATGPSGSSVTPISTCPRCPGRYLIHCHNLEHEDMAMMANYRVLPTAGGQA